MCNISHSISHVFLAWFPEEMRPTAAVCPPLLHAARSEGRQELRQLSRRLSPLREGESLATACPTNAGGFWKEGRRSTARGTWFYRTKITLKPKSLQEKLSKTLDQTHTPYGETTSPASCFPHPEGTVYLQPADICTSSGWPNTHSETTFTQTRCYQELLRWVAVGSQTRAPGPGLTRLFCITHINRTETIIPQDTAAGGGNEQFTVTLKLTAITSQ